VFSQPAIKKLLGQFSLVQLYTDKVPARYQQATGADENRRLQEERFKSHQLPFYVILEPLGGDEYKEVRRFEGGKITDVKAFARFLETNSVHVTARR
jgi:hypothetical protein